MPRPVLLMLKKFGSKMMLTFEFGAAYFEALLKRLSKILLTSSRSAFMKLGFKLASILSPRLAKNGEK